jgi:hypothetical protein
VDGCYVGEPEGANEAAVRRRTETIPRDVPTLKFALLRPWAVQGTAHDQPCIVQKKPASPEVLQMDWHCPWVC